MWISKSIPGGFSIAQQENVDPIARHNIYINNVKPSIDLEIRDFRFALNTTASSPLIVLPFTKGQAVKSKHTSSEVFEFNAKLKSVEPLAVDSHAAPATPTVPDSRCRRRCAKSAVLSQSPPTP